MKSIDFTDFCIDYRYIFFIKVFIYGHPHIVKKNLKKCREIDSSLSFFQSLTFALYLTKPFFPECDPPDDAIRLIAAVCLCFLCFVNCFSVRWATLVQDYFTYAKVFALFIIICTGIYMLAIGKTVNFSWEGTETDVTVIGMNLHTS